MLLRQIDVLTREIDTLTLRIEELIAELPDAGGAIDHQDSRHGAGISVRSSVGFHAVAQGEVGAGVDGVGGVEGVAEFGDGGGVSWRRERVEPDVQGVGGGGVGDDVAGAGQGGADEGVGFVVGAGVAGVGGDGAGQVRGRSSLSVIRSSECHSAAHRAAGGADCDAPRSSGH
jgi:hypothetical protein